MAIKNPHTYETLFFIGEQRLVQFLPLIDGSIKGLLSDMEDFIKRNSLGVFASRIEDQQSLHYCCPRCLKAFALKRVEDLNLNKIVEKATISVLDCEWGHEGYYVDEGELVRI